MQTLICRAKEQHYLFFLIILFFQVACGEKKQTPPPPVVAVDSVATRDVEIFGDYVGRTEASLNVEIRARVDGFLEERLFQEGSYVRKGQVLYVIDQRPYLASVNQFKASLNQSEVEKQKARRDVARLKPLYEQNAASQLDLDNAQSALESAEARYMMNEAQLKQSQLELEYTKIQSPLDGYISKSNVDIGTLVGPGSNSLLASVLQLDPVRVNFNISVIDYLNAQRKKATSSLSQISDSTRGWTPKVKITLPDNSEYNYDGRLNFVEPKVNPKTGTFEVQALVPNPDRIILPGQFTKVSLLLQVYEDVVVIPRKALLIEDGGAYVFIVRKDNTVERRMVETGTELDQEVLITRGLWEHEVYIKEGIHKVVPGQKVKAVHSFEAFEEALQNEQDSIAEGGDQ
ncbi:efflux RND transporter periplasmic adaptor subunit [Persicobacter diffluens]|uniref:Acriflavin resistance protein n=1 Tax=Persicobacter diffluens TaxID=981 RepID=A0AAN4W2P1_9BACT|nr:acriflavin resistance protein [Persicobacter diffluens]